MNLAPMKLLDGVLFPEAPRWHGDKLWFSDMHAHKVMTVDLDGHTEVIAELPDRPSGLGFLPDGTPIVVSFRDRLLLRLDHESVRLHADLNDVPGNHHINDMVVDRLGRAYVGVRIERPFGPGSVDEPTDGIVLVHPDGSHEMAAQTVRTPNGLVITEDGGTLIVAETQARQLVAYDIVQSSGVLANRRVFASTGDASPDGIALDASGAIWVGCPFTAEFLLIREGGDVAERIELRDGEWGLACALGGPDRRTLFMLTALTKLADVATYVDFESELRSTSRGYISTILVDVPGAGLP